MTKLSQYFGIGVLCLGLATAAYCQPQNATETTVAPTLPEKFVGIFKSQYPRVIFRKSPTGGYICEGSARDLDALASEGVGQGSYKNQKLLLQTMTDLKQADWIDLYSIEPVRKELEQRQWFSEYLDGFKAEKKIRLSPQQKLPAILAIEKGIYETSFVNMCFDPHHAIVVEAHGHCYLLLICFECHKVLHYADGEFIQQTTISNSPAKLLNQLLGQPAESE